MEHYCITAANHKNRTNHVASTFKLWRWNAADNLWHGLGAATAKKIVELIENGNEVITAKEGSDGIIPGARVEVELRIARNETEYPISEMPKF